MCYLGIPLLEKLKSKESEQNLCRCWAIAHEAEYVELAVQPGFQNRFLANLGFPRADQRQ
jgi:uncharacterized 2Fe-2S/4Fe-4S cluster protein (DUF4445 family)